MPNGRPDPTDATPSEIWRALDAETRQLLVIEALVTGEDMHEFARVRDLSMLAVHRAIVHLERSGLLAPHMEAAREAAHIRSRALVPAAVMRSTAKEARVRNWAEAVSSQDTLCPEELDGPNLSNAEKEAIMDRLRRNAWKMGQT